MSYVPPAPEDEVPAAPPMSDVPDAPDMGDVSDGGKASKKKPSESEISRLLQRNRVNYSEAELKIIKELKQKKEEDEIDEKQYLEKLQNRIAELAAEYKKIKEASDKLKEKRTNLSRDIDSRLAEVGRKQKVLNEIQGRIKYAERKLKLLKEGNELEKKKLDDVIKFESEQHEKLQKQVDKLLDEVLTAETERDGEVDFDNDKSLPREYSYLGSRTVSGLEEAEKAYSHFMDISKLKLASWTKAQELYKASAGADKPVLKLGGGERGIGLRSFPAEDFRVVNFQFNQKGEYDPLLISALKAGIYANEKNREWIAGNLPEDPERSDEEFLKAVRQMLNVDRFKQKEIHDFIGFDIEAARKEAAEAPFNKKASQNSMVDNFRHDMEGKENKEILVTLKRVLFQDPDMADGDFQRQLEDCLKRGQITAVGFNTLINAEFDLTPSYDVEKAIASAEERRRKPSAEKEGTVATAEVERTVVTATSGVASVPAKKEDVRLDKGSQTMGSSVLLLAYKARGTRIQQLQKQLGLEKRMAQEAKEREEKTRQEAERKMAEAARLAEEKAKEEVRQQLEEQSKQGGPKKSGGVAGRFGRK